MKKLALTIFAIPAFSSVAFAQHSPRLAENDDFAMLYGVADVGMAHYKTKDANGQSESATHMHSISAGSRLGVLTNENLGQGLHVRVRLEGGLNLQDGSSSSTQGMPGRIWGRNAYMEFGSLDLGVIRLGRQEGPTYNYFGPVTDPILMPAMDAWGVLTTLGNPTTPGLPNGTAGTPPVNNPGRGFMINPTGRSQNTLAYNSPILGGFTAQIAYSLNDSSSGMPKLWEVGLNYDSGPVGIKALLVRAGKTRNGGVGGTPTDSITEWALGGNYDFGFAAVYATYIHRNKTDPTQTAALYNGNSESVKIFGLSVPVSERGSVRFDYGMLSSGYANSNAKNFGVAYMYQMSKSLMLMAAATRLNQDHGATIPVFVGPTPGPGRGTTAVIVGGSYRF